ncbi:MAG: hypothetical protein ACK5DD_08175 [Cyclobacteriaceae bacterium]|jgi:hypothetical protein
MKLGLIYIALFVSVKLNGQPKLLPVVANPNCEYLELVQSGIEVAPRVKHRIIREEMSTKSYSLTIAGMFNCSTDRFFGAFKFDGDTLSIFTGAWGEKSPAGYVSEKGYAGKSKEEFPRVLCDCYFEFTYSFERIKMKPSVVYHVTGIIAPFGMTLKPLLLERTDEAFDRVTNARYTMINDTAFVAWDADSLNFVDEFGLKQGLWKEDYRTFTVNYVFFVDGISVENWAMNRFHWKTPDLGKWEQGEFVSRSLEYFPDFKLKSDCRRYLRTVKNNPKNEHYEIFEVCKTYENSGD